MERPRIAIKGGKGGGESCPYCHDALTGRGAVCATCLAVHHVECWQELGRCAGCGWTRALMPPEAVPAAPAAARAPEEAAAAPPLRVTPLCDLEEACLLLGAREGEVRVLVEAGHLPPARREGQRLLFDRSEVSRVREVLSGLRRREAQEAGSAERRSRLHDGFFGVLFAAIVLFQIGLAFGAGGVAVGLSVLGIHLLLGLGYLARRRARR